ncbi:MAG: bifunctional chorismate mutase/prephenate dehydrogenase [Sulfolobus sp.]|nr:bifunctional chorismate mutase/prephenate dehydrogenase [Sulfolobus sp.]
MIDNEISKLRNDIDKIDEEIVRLLKTRIELVKKIGEIKHKEKLPVADENRENEKLNNLVMLANELSIPTQMINNIYREIFKWSKVFQISACKRNVAIIGTGKMAFTLASLIAYGGHHVIISHIYEEEAEKLAKSLNLEYKKLKDLRDSIDIAILAVSPQALDNENFIKSLEVLKHKIVMDILSVKHGNYEKIKELSKLYDFIYISTHPLFGPSHLPVGERIAIIDNPDISEEIKNDVISFWRGLGLTPVLIDREYHDKLMATIQVIPHFMLLSMKNAIERILKELNIDLRKDCFTTNFRQIYDILNKLEDIRQVLFEIQFENPYSTLARKISLEEINKMYLTLNSQVKNP